MNTADTLRAARALIADPEHWCQGFDACDGAGRPIPPGNPDACQWCVTGAVWAICIGEGRPGIHLPPKRYRSAMTALSAAVRENATIAGDSCVVNFNDFPYTTHADVLALFDRAIKAEEEEA